MPDSRWLQPKLIISAFCLFCFFQIHAQKETNNWYFTNNQGVSFNSGNLQPINGIPANINFGYNTPVCSDANGNINFIAVITLSSTIYDRNYNLMPGPMPSGNVPLSKPLWARFPGSPSKYFIFYPTPTIYNGVYGLQYAIIDMSLNGGLGQVTVADVIVDSILSLGFCLINKPGSSGDFWIVNNKFRTDTFYARKVTSSGVDAQRTISVVGQNAVKFEYNVIAMSASPNGRMIGTSTYTAYQGPFPHRKSQIEIFNFDRQTGTLSNKSISRTTMPYYTPSLRYLEFSPDSKLLYSSENVTYTGLQPCGFSFSKIVQFDLCNTDSVSFTDRSVVLTDQHYHCTFPFFGNLQTAPNKQIYVRFGGNAISSIKYPNKKGTAANFVLNEYNAGPGLGAQLPAFAQMEMQNALGNSIVSAGGCYPNPVNFSLAKDNVDHVLWNFGDPGSGAQNTSTSFNPSHLFSAPGLYTVTVSLYDINNVLIEILTEVVDVKDPAAKLMTNLPLDTVLCSGNDLFINLTTSNAYFEWSKTNPGNPTIIPLGISDTITINSPGKYYVKMVQNGCSGCELYDSINVNITTGPTVNLGGDRFLCTNQSIRIGVADPANNISCVWSTSETTDSITVINPGQYWVRAEMNNNGCIRSDTINFEVNPVISFSLPPDTLLCIGQSLLLNATLAGAQYLWQDNSISPTFNVTAPGLYWVRLLYDGCAKTDSINVAYVPGQQVNLGADTSLCFGNNLILSSNVSGNAYLWSNGAATSSIQVNSSGIYWIKVLLNTGCWATDTINVQFNPAAYFSFGADTTLCENKNLLLTTSITGATYLWQDNSTAASYLVNSPGLYWLEVTKNGCVHRDSLNVTYIPAPVLDFGNDSSICSGSVLLLDATHPNTVSYLWQDATTNPTYTLTASGLYFAEVTSANGCKKSDSIVVTVIPLPSFNLGDDTTICSANPLVLQTNIGGLPHLWSNGFLTNSILVNTAGLYWAEVDNIGCKKRDSINVFVKSSPSVNLGNDTLLCNTETILLDATNSNALYLWQNGNTQPQFPVSLPGIYNVEVNKNGCYAFDTIKINYNYKPVFSLGPDKNVCNDNSILLDPGVANANYLWQDGSTNVTYLIQRSGLYSVNISNQCGFLSDSILIQKGGCQLYVPNSFTPNGDGKNDIFRPLTDGNIKFYEFIIYNRYGETLYQSNDPLRGWDGTYRGEKQSFGTYVWKCTYQIDNLMKNIETGTIMLIR